MQPWQQNYDAAGNIWLSALAALIPIIFFFLALTRLRMKGYVAGTVTVLLALGVALFFYQMPLASALAAAVSGGGHVEYCTGASAAGRVEGVEKVAGA